MSTNGLPSTPVPPTAAGSSASCPTPAGEAEGLRLLPVLERAPRRHPSWVKTRFSGGERYEFLRKVLREKGLHTVCEEAECPNIGECWSHGTATFMLLGDTCTRTCAFCAVGKGRPLTVDDSEPEHVAEVIEALQLDYAVLTSVNRDDLPDEGAGHFAATIEAIRRRLPDCRVEALVPDFHGRPELIERVASSPLFVYAHNVETVPRLYRRVRPGSDYRRSLAALATAKSYSDGQGSSRSELLTKSSVMLGLGETRAEVVRVMEDLRENHCDILTLGQYLQPTQGQLDVFRYIPPQEFAELRETAEGLGFRQVVSGPLVRSSYHAWETVEVVGREKPAQVADGGPGRDS